MPPALGMQSINHWTMTEIPRILTLSRSFFLINTFSELAYRYVHCALHSGQLHGDHLEMHEEGDQFTRFALRGPSFSIKVPPLQLLNFTCSVGSLAILTVLNNEEESREHP